MSRHHSTLRILLVTPDYGSVGGIQTLVRNLQRGLKELGITVEVLHIPPSINFPLRAYLPRHKWYNSLIDLKELRGPYRETIYRLTSEKIRKFHPDLVHVFHIQQYPALLSSKDSSLPGIVSTHALELRDGPTAQAAFKLSDKIHTVSDFTAGLVSNISENQVESYKIPPSIDVNSFKSTPTENKGESTSGGPVVTLARLDESYKNIETVINAWACVADEVVENHKLIIAGDGPRRNKFERLASSLNNVEFIGLITEEEKRKLLRHASVFAFVPEQDGFRTEGFGITFIEAQAAGTPVVGSTSGGAPEAVGDGGILVDNETDPTEVAAAIERLLTESKLRQSCMEGISKRIMDFDIVPIAKQHLNFYELLL